VSLVHDIARTNDMKCSSMCTAVMDVDGSCGDSLQTVGISLNCSSSIYDPSDDTDVCNALLSTEVGII
jgi:hypothetical protein